MKGRSVTPFVAIAGMVALPLLLAIPAAIWSPLGNKALWIGAVLSVLLLALSARFFAALLAPVMIARDALREFSDRGVRPDLPADTPGLGGQLFAEVQRALLVADQARKQQFVDATTDPLTGLLSRRAASRRLGSDLLRSLRDKKPMCVAVAEIENAEQLTSQFGHDAMDKVVKVVAERISASLRRSDWVAHFGDHEFLIGLWGVDIEAARLAVDRVIEEVDSNKNAPVRLNIGVCQSSEGSTPERATTLCVSAMYKARKTPGSAVEYVTDTPV